MWFSSMVIVLLYCKSGLTSREKKMSVWMVTHPGPIWLVGLAYKEEDDMNVDRIDMIDVTAK